MHYKQKHKNIIMEKSYITVRKKYDEKTYRALLPRRIGINWLPCEHLTCLSDTPKKIIESSVSETLYELRANYECSQCGSWVEYTSPFTELKDMRIRFKG